jgi:hypothetical protein
MASRVKSVISELKYLICSLVERSVTKGEEEKVGKDDARHMSRLIMTEVIIQLGGVVIGQGFAGF